MPVSWGFSRCQMTQRAPIIVGMIYSRFAPGALLLNVALLLLSATPLFAQPSSRKASPTSTATPAPTADTQACELHVVNNMIKECCQRVGPYIQGYRNCTNFRKTFDDLCASAIGRSRCRSVTIWCPGAEFGHALNLIQMSDGMWYLVEPQGWVYEEYPLPSPQLTDAALAAAMPGCGCHSEVSDYATAPNTDPSQCAGNDFDLIRSNSKNPPHEKCLQCCKNSTPPRHPAPAEYFKECERICGLTNFDLPPDKYCAHAYVGKACEACCEVPSSVETALCKSQCPPTEQWGEIPLAPPDSCAAKEADTTACDTCCEHQIDQCSYRWSMACSGWDIACKLKCASGPQLPKPTPTLAATSTAAPRAKT